MTSETLIVSSLFHAEISGEVKTEPDTILKYTDKKIVHEDLPEVREKKDLLAMIENAKTLEDFKNIIKELI